MFEMNRALLACQHHPLPNGAERKLFSKHPNVKFFFFMAICEHVTMICEAGKLEVVGLLFPALDACVCLNRCLHSEIGFLL